MSPRKPEKRLADIIFDKQIGRNEGEHLQENLKDELIVEPNIDVVRKRK